MSDEHKDQSEIQHEIETDAISPRTRAEKKKGGGADRDNKSYEGGVAGIAGTGGSSGAGSVRANVEGMGSLSGISPDLEEGEAPMPGSIGKHRGGTRDHQMSDGGLPGKTSGTGGDTVPNQSGGKKGQQGQRDGQKSNKTQR
ncbi:MAG TPA: hypothetical protein PKD53_15655 [Chloroflexaceae bacterium]|nr:hypothetical protein [Chloroflexaceae bacterium]